MMVVVNQLLAMDCERMVVQLIVSMLTLVAARRLVVSRRIQMVAVR